MRREAREERRAKKILTPKKIEAKTQTAPLPFRLGALPFARGAASLGATWRARRLMATTSCEALLQLARCGVRSFRAAMRPRLSNLSLCFAPRSATPPLGASRLVGASGLNPPPPSSPHSRLGRHQRKYFNALYKKSKLRVSPKKLHVLYELPALRRVGRITHPMPQRMRELLQGM